MQQQRAVVLGAGSMGGLISFLLALAGHEVTVVDLKEDALAAAQARHHQLLASEPLDASEQAAFRARISWLVGVVGESDAIAAALRTATIVIEAVDENLAVKRALFNVLDQICPPTTVLATNSSSIMARNSRSLGSHAGSSRGISPRSKKYCFT